MAKSPMLLIFSIAVMLAGCELGTESTPQANVQGEEANSSLAAKTNKQSRMAQGDLRFIEGYQRGYDRALSDGKPMLVFFTAEWCQYCHQMANEAFTHEQVVNLSKEFVCILVDADAEPEVCRQFHVQGYPTIQFLSPRGAPLNRIIGKKPGHQLMIAMQAALQNVARRDESGDPSKQL